MSNIEIAEKPSRKAMAVNLLKVISHIEIEPYFSVCHARYNIPEILCT